MSYLDKLRQAADGLPHPLNQRIPKQQRLDAWDRFIATFDPPMVLTLLEIAETVEVYIGAGSLHSPALADALHRLREVTS